MRDDDSLPRYPAYTVLGDLIVYRKVLFLYCADCRHSTEKDPARLARRLGYDATLLSVIERARCSKCGAKEVQGSVRDAEGGR